MKWLSRNWPLIKEFVIQQLQGAAVKAALKKLLGSAAAGGFKAWAIKFVVNELFEEIAEPLIKVAFVSMGYQFNRLQGEIIVKRIIKAQGENDQQAYDSAIDDIFKPRSK